MAATKKPKTSSPSPMSYSSLSSLLGKPTHAPEVEAVLKGAGKVQHKPEAIIAKDAGFEFKLKDIEGLKVLHTLFLSGEPGITELPPGFAFTTREALHRAASRPKSAWLIGSGDVLVETPKVSIDRWRVGDFDFSARYGPDGVVSKFIVMPSQEIAGRSLASHPLQFEPMPHDAPNDAALTAMALLVAWASERFGLPAKHAGTPNGEKLLDRTISPRTFLIESCGKTLSTLDFDPKLDAFLYGYVHGLLLSDEQPRAGAQVAQLLRLSQADADGVSFAADFLGTFADLESRAYVPDAWHAVDRLAPVLDARWADYEATRFRAPPDSTLYEKAVALRDAVTVAPSRARVEPRAVDAALADELVGLIDKPLTDKTVKAVLSRADLPVGKRVDQQANPAFGVAYMGNTFSIGGASKLGVEDVTFFAAKQRRYIRGIGAEVEFAAWPSKLPFDVQWGDSPAAVEAKVKRAPKSRTPGYAHYDLGETRVAAFEFDDGKLVMVRIGRPNGP